MRRLKAILTFTAAAGITAAASPAALALDCVGKRQGSMDMSSWTAVLASFGVLLGSGFLILRGGGLPKLRVFFCVLTALLFAAAPVFDNADAWYRAKHPFVAASPALEAQYAAPQALLVTDADFYVSLTGNDAADGSVNAPFATLERAKEAVRALDKTGRTGVTVAVKAGEYRISSFSLTAQDGGTADCPVTWCAYGDGEVILNGGLTVPPAAFSPVSDDEMRARLHADAADHVVVADLFALGLTPSDYGKLYAIGSYQTAAQYTGDYSGPIYSELFFNDTRCTLARYPDTGYLKTTEVVSEGEGRENSSREVNPNWGAIANPVSDVYRVDAALALRIGSWQTLDDVWMYGYWMYDWADASTPIGSFHAETRELSPKFVSLYGARTGAPYYFYNVFEELDAPGEWYLDRENGKLYLYPPAELENATVDLSLSTAPVVTVSGANYLTFRGFTVKGTRADAMQLSGDHNVVERCLLKNVAGSALLMSGSDNLVRDNEITRTGKGGITLIGGDETTLTPGNNRAENNLIHDWSEIYQTYQPAVSLYGVGNVCAHNEMYNSPHEAVTYGGNNHLIAYNEIHHVCLLSSDAGAIYAGRSWCSYGTRIEYNCIYDLGSGDFTPCGIYMDDALSGQTIVGNLLVNIPGFALHLGGGRDLDVRNNIVISGGQRGISYDQRAIDGVFGGWFAEHSGESGNMWTELRASPWQTEIWKNAYPQMALFSDDFSDPDDPDFVPNPAYSTVCNNLFVTGTRSVGSIDEKVRKYSEFTGNALFSPRQMERLFRDPDNGDYTLLENAPVYMIAPDFTSLPLDRIGRIDED